MKHDPKCPRCRGQMVKRTQRKSGSIFWGCWNWPQCTGTINIGTRDYFPIPSWMAGDDPEEDPLAFERDPSAWDDLQSAIED